MNNVIDLLLYIREYAEKTGTITPEMQAVVNEYQRVNKSKTNVGAGS